MAKKQSEIICSHQIVWAQKFRNFVSIAVEEQGVELKERIQREMRVESIHHVFEIEIG